MTNQEVKEIFWQTYNNFWNKWKDVPLTRHSQEWDDVMIEYCAIMEKHNNDLCRHIMVDLITELEERYKEKERVT